MGLSTDILNWNYRPIDPLYLPIGSRQSNSDLNMFDVFFAAVVLKFNRCEDSVSVGDNGLSKIPLCVSNFSITSLDVTVFVGYNYMNLVKASMTARICL